MPQNGVLVYTIQQIEWDVECPSTMPDPKRTWRIIIPIAILVFLIATTVGSAWHHHATASAYETCPICHLSHQIIEPSRPAILVHAPVPIGTSPEPQAIRLIGHSDVRRIPSRAPPA